MSTGHVRPPNYCTSQLPGRRLSAALSQQRLILCGANTLSVGDDFIILLLFNFFSLSFPTDHLAVSLPKRARKWHPYLKVP